MHEELSKQNTVFNDLNIYERHLPKDINKFSYAKLKNITHVCITSIDILNNFLSIYNILKLDTIENLIFVAGNKRIASECKKNSPKNEVLISLNPSNEEMLKTILK